MCAYGKARKGATANDSRSDGVVYWAGTILFQNVPQCCYISFSKKKKAIHKNLHYPQSLAEKTIQYLSGSWRSSYFLSFEANEKIAKEKARKSDETKYKHQAKCNL